MSTQRKRPASEAPKKSGKDLPDWLEETEGGARITLNVPLKIGGVKTGVLEMRRPKLRDRREADKMFKENEAEEKELHLFSNLTDMTPDEMDEIDLDDYVRMQFAFQNFLSSRQMRT